MRSGDSVKAARQCCIATAAVIGFTVGRWEVLAHALQNYAAEHEVSRTVKTPYGAKYVVEGRLETPGKRSPIVRSVWIIERDNNIPRLVTAHSGE